MFNYTKTPKNPLFYFILFIIYLLYTGDLSIYCYINRSEDEEIQSLFYNKLNDSFIVCASFNNQVLKVRYITLSCIQVGISKGVDILTTESIKFPGWLEYDDQENRILTFNHNTELIMYLFYDFTGFK